MTLLKKLQLISNCEYETFCYKFHIWLDKRFQKYIGILAVMLDIGLSSLSRKNRVTKRLNLSKNNTPKIKKRDFIHDKLKLLLISDVSFTPPIPLPPMTAGLELAFEAKGACALQKGQCPFCKSCNS